MMNFISATTNVVMIVVLVVLFVGMMAISIIPQKKRQRQFNEMQAAIKVGTRVMTIGRLVGTVVAVNTDNTIEVDIGAKGSPVVIVVNREGIGMNLDAPVPGTAASRNYNSSDSSSEASTEQDLEDAVAGKSKKKHDDFI